MGVATNANSILHNTLTTGEYRPAGVQKTLSPSMDIQVASNFERLLYNACGNDGDKIRARMEDFAQQNTLRIPDGEIAAIRSDFVSYAVDDEMTLAEIKTHYAKTGGLIDPHTAVGRVAAQAHGRQVRQHGHAGGQDLNFVAFEI